MDAEKTVVWTLEQLRTRREQILQLAETHGAFNVRIFGSVARHEARPESDVDLLVSVRAGVSMFNMIALWLDLQEMLGCKVSLITDGIEDTAFLRRIQTDALVL